MSDISKTVVHIDQAISQIAQGYVVNTGAPVAMIICFNMFGQVTLPGELDGEGVPSSTSGMGHWPIGIPFIMDSSRNLSELSNQNFYELRNVAAAFLVLFSPSGYRVVKLYKNPLDKWMYVSSKLVDEIHYTNYPQPRQMSVPQKLANTIFPHKILTMQFTPNRGCFVSMSVRNLCEASQKYAEKNNLDSLLPGGKHSVDYIPLGHIEDSFVKINIPERALEQTHESWMLFMVQLNAWLYIALHEPAENQKITLEFVTMTGHRVCDEIDLREFTGDRESRMLFGDDLAYRQSVIGSIDSQRHPIAQYINHLADRVLEVLFLKLHVRTNVLFEYGVYMLWKKKYEELMR